MQLSKVGIIVVTHNSQDCLPSCLQAIHRQTLAPAQIVIIDAGSADTGYLDRIQTDNRILCKKTGNIGFSKANNLGYKILAGKTDIYFFLIQIHFSIQTVLKRQGQN